MGRGAGVRAAAAEDVAAVERESHRQQNERERERDRSERQQVTRLTVAAYPAEPAQGEIENAAREPVVDESHEQPGDEEPDRDHDSGPCRVVGKRRRLSGGQSQREPGQEHHGDDRVLAIVRRLPRIVAQR